LGGRIPGFSVKVAIYVSELDVKGGTHKQVLRLAQHLRARQHDVRIITARYVPNLGYPEFTDFPILTMPEFSSLGLFGKLLNRLRPAWLAMRMPSVDIVNVHDNRGLLFGLVAKILGKSKRYAWQINDLDPAFKIGAHSKHQRPTIRDIRQRIVNRWWAHWVDAITVNVSKNRTRVQEFLGQDATVLFCGVDFPETTFAVQAASTPFRLLSLGVFFPYRNYETLVIACAQANQQLDKPIHLTIVGDTRYNLGYVEKLRNLAVTAKVTLTIYENLSQADLDSQIADNHAFAFVNVDQSWGLAVFEVAARSTPVILSQSVGACELLGGKPGFLMVDPLSPDEIAAAIVSLATDAQKLMSTAVMARNTVKDMTWVSLYCEPSEALFERLLATRV
jgi:glycosyltransferase involved in cell wall biosynthesis